MKHPKYEIFGYALNIANFQNWEITNGFNYLGCKGDGLKVSIPGRGVPPKCTKMYKEGGDLKCMNTEHKFFLHGH